MKQNEIIEMFDNIAPSYDLVNKVVSFGVDKKWREIAIKESLKFIKPTKVLDIACGTGDMIQIWQKHNINICGIDPSIGMLEVAKKRFKDVKFYNLSATNLNEIEDKYADVISISFGIRNVLEIQKAINEFRRVLNDNGIIVILEFTKSNNSMRKFIDLYTNNILPKIGGIISKNHNAYKYLSTSIEKYYTANELIRLFEIQNFQLLKLKTFNFGQVSLILLKKLP